jgi:hypothetical protein
MFDDLLESVEFVDPGRELIVNFEECSDISEFLNDA